DQVFGIENGADDFIVKPFSLEVLLAKIKSQLRRNYGEYVDNKEQKMSVFGNTTLDASKGQISTLEGVEHLSLRELGLAKAMFEQPDNVISRQTLFTLLWDTNDFVEENTLTVNIGRLRKKLARIESSLEIKVIRGLGYQLSEQKK
ncbi:MAG: response regulator transcription factor, partial [Enterococcus gilvus]